jgi:NAD(P)-dependent dehydrogenase (short-subunit alcohol dehydrogenase family)
VGNLSFVNRRILVVGGSSGLGRATARRLIEGGAAVAVIGHRAEKVEKCASETGAVGIVADMRDEEQANHGVSEAADRLGGLDGLVNCIGNSDHNKIDDITLDLWNEMLALNATTHFLACRAALPRLREVAGSSIVNVSAVAGVTPGMTGAAYAAAKAAVIQFTMNLAAQLAPHVRANVVSPGAIRTQRLHDVFLSKRTPDQVGFFLSRYALNRLAEPDEIAALIAFLLSDDAAYITGSNFVADGGRAYY